MQDMRRKTLNKQEMVEKIRDKGLTKHDAEVALNVFFETIKETLAAKESISLRGFGTFAIVERKERNGRNPRTGVEVKIPARNSVKFIPSNEMKKLVNS